MGDDGFASVNRRAEAVFRHVRGRRRVTGRTRRCRCRWVRRCPSRSMRRGRRLLRVTDPDLSVRPCPCRFYGEPRPIVRTHFDEQRQHMFRAFRRPDGQEPVVGKGKRPVPMHRNETFVSHRQPVVAIYADESDEE